MNFFVVSFIITRLYSIVKSKDEKMKGFIFIKIKAHTKS